MTTFENTLAELNKEQAEGYKRLSLLEENRRDRLSRVFNNAFGGVLEFGDTLLVGKESVAFNRVEGFKTYSSQMISLYFSNKDWKIEEADEIRTSFHSSSVSSEFELRRMILIGKIGKILLDHSDDILRDYNQVIKDTKAEIREQYNLINIISKDMKFIEDELRDIKKQSLLDTLENEGIEFELKEGERVNELPNIDVKFDKTICNVKSIKILNKTASGKSACIALKIMNNIWNSDTQSYNAVQEDRIVDKVRMNNIEGFIQYNSNKISVS